MPRKAAIVPNRHYHTTFPPDLAAKLDIFLYSEVEGRVPRSAYQSFFVALTREFFSSRTVDLSPYLGTMPGEVKIRGNEHSIIRLIHHLKEVTQHVQSRTPSQNDPVEGQNPRRDDHGGGSDRGDGSPSGGTEIGRGLDYEGESDQGQGSDSHGG